MEGLQSSSGYRFEEFQNSAGRAFGICLWLPRPMHRLS
jgi:hypothetical protein